MIIIRERGAKQTDPTSFLRAKLGECGVAGFCLGHIVFRQAQRESFRSNKHFNKFSSTLLAQKYITSKAAKKQPLKWRRWGLPRRRCTSLGINFSPQKAKVLQKSRTLWRRWGLPRLRCTSLGINFSPKNILLQRLQNSSLLSGEDGARTHDLLAASQAL
jgi:hypothetical protein